MIIIIPVGRGNISGGVSVYLKFIFILVFSIRVTNKFSFSSLRGGFPNFFQEASTAGGSPGTKCPSIGTHSHVHMHFVGVCVSH